MLQKLLEGLKKLGSMVNIGDKTKSSFQALKDDVVGSFVLRKPDLDLDYDPATGKVVLELNHTGCEARLPFGKYLVDGAHQIGIGVLEGNEQREVLAPSMATPKTEE